MPCTYFLMLKSRCLALTLRDACARSRPSRTGSSSKLVAERLAAAMPLRTSSRRKRRNARGVARRRRTGIGAVQQFEDLRLPCSLVTADQSDWLKIWGSDDNVAAHELLQGAEAARSEYNHRSLTHVARTKRPWQATHRGFSDLFVPDPASGALGRVFGLRLVHGRSTWSASDIREQWQKLDRATALAERSRFVSYAEAVLARRFSQSRQRAPWSAILMEFAKLLGNSRPVRAGPRPLAPPDAALLASSLAFQHVAR